MKIAELMPDLKKGKRARRKLWKQTSRFFYVVYEDGRFWFGDTNDDFYREPMDDRDLEVFKSLDDFELMEDGEC